MKQKLALILLALFSLSLLAQTSPSSHSASGKRSDGFIPFTWDEKKGALLFELSPKVLNREFLYFVAMGSGVGSTELFADRSTLSERSLLCRFRRVGPKVLVIAENM
jgi:hypothetical protein